MTETRAAYGLATAEPASARLATILEKRMLIETSRVLTDSKLSATDTFEHWTGLLCYIFFCGYSRTLAYACSINLSALAVRLHPSLFV